MSREKLENKFVFKFGHELIQNSLSDLLVELFVHAIDILSSFLFNVTNRAELLHQRCSLFEEELPLIGF
jgi:hypothetical protein